MEICIYDLAHKHFAGRGLTRYVSVYTCLFNVDYIYM